MRFLNLAPEYRVGPLETRYESYFLARLAEMTGDTAAAIDRYDGLIDEWPGGLDGIPTFGDVRARRAALASP